LGEGVSATVTLKCAATMLGHLARCAVQSETTPGFGMAALKLAPDFRVHPATLDGVVVPDAPIDVEVTFDGVSPARPAACQVAIDYVQAMILSRNDWRSWAVVNVPFDARPRFGLSVNEVLEAPWKTADEKAPGERPPAKLVKAYLETPTDDALWSCPSFAQFLDNVGIPHHGVVAKWPPPENRSFGASLASISGNGREAVMIGSDGWTYLRRDGDGRWKVVGVAKPKPRRPPPQIIPRPPPLPRMGPPTPPRLLAQPAWITGRPSDL
jgi:hypothetical protein